MKRFSILFVCSANVCRSPSALALASQRLGDLDLRHHLTLQSAGVDAISGVEWCPEASDWIGRNRPLQAEPGLGSSTLVTVAMVEKAGLILAADRQTTTGLLGLAPRSRPRIFTLREARALGRAALAPFGEERQAPASIAEPVSDSSAGGGTSERLRRWVEEMDFSRGRVPLESPPEPRTGLLRRRISVPPADIPDAHVPNSKVRHSDVLPWLSTCVDDVVESIAFVVADRNR